MLGGVLALCAITVPVGILLAASEVPVNLTTFFGCLIAGARRGARQRRHAHERGQVPRPPRGRPVLHPAGGRVPALHRRRSACSSTSRSRAVIRQLDVPTDDRDRFGVLPARLSGRVQRAAGQGGAALHERADGQTAGYAAGSDERRRSTRACPTRRVTPSASSRSSRSWASRRPQPARSRKRASAISPAARHSETTMTAPARRRGETAQPSPSRTSRLPLEEAGELGVLDPRRPAPPRRPPLPPRPPPRPAAPACRWCQGGRGGSRAVRTEAVRARPSPRARWGGAPGSSGSAASIASSSTRRSSASQSSE